MMVNITSLSLYISGALIDHDQIALMSNNMIDTKEIFHWSLLTVKQDQLIDIIIKKKALLNNGHRKLFSTQTIALKKDLWVCSLNISSRFNAIWALLMGCRRQITSDPQVQQVTLLWEAGGTCISAQNQGDMTLRNIWTVENILKW